MNLQISGHPHRCHLILQAKSMMMRQNKREDLDKLEKMLSEKKDEILSLLDSKISESESDLQSARLAESNARYALNMALNGN